MRRRRAPKSANLLLRERAVGLPPLRPGGARVCVVYPNTYHVGMSNLGLHTILRLFREADGLRVDRAFLPDDPSRAPQTLESGERLAAQDVLAFSISFESDSLGVAWLLRQAGLAVLRAERRPGDPLVIAGGPAVSANPAPLSEICDALFIGEVEEQGGALAQAFAAAAATTPHRRDEQWRAAVLSELAQVPGMYVPELTVPGTVERQVARDLEAFETVSRILTPATEFSDCFLVEVGRGCRRGCRFCLAAQLYKPARTRAVGTIVASASRGLNHTNRIGLVSATLSDYPQAEQVVRALLEQGARVSTSSLRLESLTPCAMQSTSRPLRHKSGMPWSWPLPPV